MLLLLRMITQILWLLRTDSFSGDEICFCEGFALMKPRFFFACPGPNATEKSEINAYPCKSFTKSCSCWLAIVTRWAPSIAQSALASSYFFLLSHLMYWCPFGPTEYWAVAEQSAMQTKSVKNCLLIVQLKWAKLASNTTLTFCKLWAGKHFRDMFVKTDLGNQVQMVLLMVLEW